MYEAALFSPDRADNASSYLPAAASLVALPKSVVELDSADDFGTES